MPAPFRSISASWRSFSVRHRQVGGSFSSTDSGTSACGSPELDRTGGNSAGIYFQGMGKREQQEFCWLNRVFGLCFLKCMLN